MLALLLLCFVVAPSGGLEAEAELMVLGPLREAIAKHSQRQRHRTGRPFVTVSYAQVAARVRFGSVSRGVDVASTHS